MADIIKRAPVCDDDRRGKRGKRGKRGRDAGESIFPPFANPTVFTTVYARATGSDEHGNGTLAKPYRTFQRAIRDTPHNIPTGTIFTVDITGIGTELLPVNYQFPAINAPDILTFAPESGGLSVYPFSLGSWFNVRAFPQPASNIPLADTTVPAADIVAITGDPVTNLVTIEVAPARASWAADSLKGKLFLEANNSFGSCAIYGSDATHLFLCTTPGFLVGTEDLSIVEPSAELRGEYTVASGFGAISINNCHQMALQGIKFSASDPDGFGPFSNALAFSGGPVPTMILCDIEGVWTQWVSSNFIVGGSVVRDKVIGADGSAFTSANSLILDVPVIFVAGSAGNVWRETVTDGCGGLGEAGAHSTFGLFPAAAWVVTNALFKNGTDLNGAIHAQHSDTFIIDSVQIDQPVGPGILVEGNSYAVLTNVDGTNGGVGVKVTDGASVRVTDDATVITGAGGDMEVGTLAVRTWIDFRGTAPIKNQYDLTTPFVLNTAGETTPPGEELTGAGGRSGSRLFQRP